MTPLPQTKVKYKFSALLHLWLFFFVVVVVPCYIIKYWGAKPYDAQGCCDGLSTCRQQRLDCLSNFYRNCFFLPNRQISPMSAVTITFTDICLENKFHLNRDYGWFSNGNQFQLQISFLLRNEFEIHEMYRFRCISRFNSCYAKEIMKFLHTFSNYYIKKYIVCWTKYNARLSCELGRLFFLTKQELFRAFVFNACAVLPSVLCETYFCGQSTAYLNLKPVCCKGNQLIRFLVLFFKN